MSGAAARGWIVVAALSGAVSVAMGAFAAHGFDAGTEAGRRARDLLQTGSHYEIFHALAMLGICALTASKMLNGKLAVAALWLFFAGSILFPGALYSLALGGPRWFGAVAPVGGLAFIAGWVLVAVAALKRSTP
jgi:uncharacterized membrane protein YgdD (TMEM256/DUF423 family)